MLAEVTTASKGFLAFLGDNLHQIIANTGFANVTSGHLIMIGVGLFFLYLAISRNFEPMLLVPIGFGILVGNIPFSPGMEIGIYEDGSVLNYLYFGVIKGIYPPLIFLGIGAMTDFSALISNPKLMLVGAAAQIGIFATYMGALALGFTAAEAGAIGIIGGADGPTAIFLTSKLAPDLLGAISISAYSYMALVPVIQPPVMRLFTTKKERLIHMKPPRQVSTTEKILFPIIGLLLTTFVVPSAIPLLGTLFFGNLLKECGVTKRFDDRHRDDPAGFHRRCIDTGHHVPDAQIALHFHHGRLRVLRGFVLRRAVREVLQPVPAQGCENQPADRQRRRIGRTCRRTRIAGNGIEV